MKRRKNSVNKITIVTSKQILDLGPSHLGSGWNPSVPCPQMIL